LRRNDPINLHADSVIDLLIAQCQDLESLLALARREEQAAEDRNFDEILRVVEERATLGERLETYHRQIADLRLKLGDAAEPAFNSDAATRTAATIAEIQATDSRTQPLLLAARNDFARDQQRLDKARQGVAAYLQEAPIAIACDHRV
jgi:flagellar biosynthesis/type III secretory pathway chaperone